MCIRDSLVINEKMKKLILFCIPLFISCVSNKSIVQNFILEDLKNDTLDNILIKEKYSFEKAMFVFHGVSIKPIIESKKINIKELQKKYSNDKTTFWGNDDFKKIKFTIVDFNDIDKFISERNNSLKNKYYANRFNVFFLSNPYFYNHNKNLFFYITKIKPSRNRVIDEAIIMEKKNGKWIVIDLSLIHI